jgi:PelA/Pel-15E family pectate lyase
MSSHRPRPLSAVILIGLAIGPFVPATSAKSFSWREFVNKPDDWFRGEEGKRTTAVILSHQSEQGSWPKNLDTSEKPFQGDRSKIEGTFDNGATFGELRYLARAYNVANDPHARDAFLKGLDLTLAAPYPNGGFPQHYPTSKTGYDRHITFNDGTMVNILEFLRDVGRSDDFAFAGPGRQAKARDAFAKGIDCIVACQIKVGGKLTAWCAQHDRETLEPRGARTYELPSLSGGESAAILLLLMSLDHPSPDVVRAIHAGTHWFNTAKLTGIRQTQVDGNKIIVADRDAPPLWARFYEIDTNRPFFCGRDGVKKYDIAAIEPERRNGYAWYGNWGQKVADRYAQWTKEQAKKARS